MKIIFPLSKNELLSIEDKNNINFKNNKIFWLKFENPIKTFCIFNNKDKEKVKQELNNFYKYLQDTDYFFAGFFSYELGYYLLNIKSNNKTLLLNLPLLYGGFFTSYKIYVDFPHSDLSNPECFINSIHFMESFSHYKKNINFIKELIEKGQVYQINYTFPLKLNIFGNIEKLFYYLWNKQKSTNSCLIIDEDFYILSLSPELFFYLNNDTIYLKPMKGTYKKSLSLRKNIEGILYLKNSLKEKSENAMIVDLIRNDLGRISAVGSVKINHLFKIEIYDTIIQMITEITSKLKFKPRTKMFWESLFPSGSVTGAPKISAMKYIHNLETYSRSIYTGSIGWIIKNHAKFNVAIRTIFGNNHLAYYFVGSGVTYDSNPIKEFFECVRKAQVIKETQKILKPEYIFTTMKFSGGIIYFEKSHINRLINTKIFFQYPIKNQKIIDKIQHLKELLKSYPYPIRIHFRIYKNGKIYIKLSKINIRKKIKITLSNLKINSNNIFLYYKTSNRQIYHQELEKYKDTYDEVIFQNQNGFITEGSFTNIVVKINNQYFTPPTNAGLLKGIFREKLIKKGIVQEKNITIRELFEAEEILLINSVRGILKAQIT